MLKISIANVTRQNLIFVYGKLLVRECKYIDVFKHVPACVGSRMNVLTHTRYKLNSRTAAEFEPQAQYQLMREARANGYLRLQDLLESHINCDKLYLKKRLLNRLINSDALGSKFFF